MPLPNLPRPMSRRPQSPCRQNRCEQRRHADRDQCPHEEEPAAGTPDAAVDPHSPALHMNDWYHQRKERQEQVNDVPRATFSEHERGVQPKDNDRYGREVGEMAFLESADDIVGQVKAQ